MRTPLLILLVACSSPPVRPVETVTPPREVPSGDAAPKPEAKRRTPRYDARTLYETVSMSGGSFSHDGTRILISSDATGVFNVYAQPVAGGPPVQLTKSVKDSNFAVSFFPTDDRYLFSADNGGNELTHIWVAEKDGTTKDLTAGDKVKASFFGWSKDRKAFYVITNERDPKFFDLYRYATDGYARTMVFKNTDGYHVGAISPDGRQIALTKTNNNADSDLFLTDGKAKPALITKHTGMIEHRPFEFTPDNTKLVYSTNGAGEFTQAWTYDLKTRKSAALASAQWDISAFYYSENGAYRVVMTNEDARTVLAIAAKSGAAVTPKDLPKGDITRASFDRAEKQMAFYLSSDRTPADLYVLDLATGATRRLSNNLDPKVDPAHLVDGEVVRYKSFDGLEIPSVLYRPLDAAPNAKVPALVFVHGGPGGQSRLGYNPLLQYLANHGYAVLAVNNRGSSGYGKTFHHMDDRKHGDVDLKDCVQARTYLASLDWIDGKRVGIIGGSYGGYMTVAALAFAPDAFDVGIDIFGVTNWIRTLESIPAWWSAQRTALYAELGDPATDKDRLTAISPLFHAHKIKKPLLVVQGANDPRVLKVESDEIVAAVKKNGVPVEYLVFEDEGHGFQKKKNQIAAAEKYVTFLEAHLAK
jgi:dipeptidyl aminopeptidase/acylaminoacyl peptidase